MSKPRILLIILAVICILTSAGFGLYPVISDYYYETLHKHTISEYNEQVAEIDDKDINAMLTAAKEYNKTLLKTNTALADNRGTEQYNKLLSVDNSGIMGYVRIPKIDVFVPVYHGTKETVLQVGAGHLPSSSLPVGGIGSHCVITGHSGLRSAKLFTDLDQLTTGDKFTVTVLTKTLTYEIDRIKTVKPSETEDLSIDPNQDYCTLVTCTPYGVNTHRLLVRGHRIETPKNMETKVLQKLAENTPNILPVIIAVMILLIAILIIYLWIRKQRKKTKGDNIQ